uniref:Uncharacterized protein n=1 Tax=Zea mays TaxID=4577 RepID=A0A804LSJ3_MAIZE
MQQELQQVRTEQCEHGIRYLTLSPQRVSLVYAGHAAVQGAYDAVEQGDVLWVPVRVALDIRVVGVDVLMLHVSNRLGASSAPPPGTPPWDPPSI